MNVEEFEIPRRDNGSLKAEFYKSPVKRNDSEKNPIVILCHGFPGDKKEMGRFPILAEKLINVGIDVVAFDFAGYGENEREPIHLLKQVENLEDVYSWSLSLGYEKIGTLGHSFGGQTSLVANLPKRAVAVFWAPAFYMSKIPTKALKPIAKLFFQTDKRKVHFPNHEHEKVYISKLFFDDLYEYIPEKIDEFLSAFAIPTLIIQGSTDPVVRPWNTRLAFSKMPQDEHHQLKYVKKAGHIFLDEKLDYFVNYAVEWFTKYLK